MSPEGKESSPKSELEAVIGHFEALAVEIQRAIDSLTREDSADSIARLEKAKAAALHGAALARSKLRSL